MGVPRRSITQRGQGGKEGGRAEQQNREKGREGGRGEQRVPRRIGIGGETPLSDLGKEAVVAVAMRDQVPDEDTDKHR